MKKLNENQKVWFDKKYKDSYSTREEKIADFRRSVEINKRHKYKPRRCIVINNGIVAKQYNEDLPIPEGWKRGLLKRGARNEQQSEQN